MTDGGAHEGAAAAAPEPASARTRRFVNAAGDPVNEKGDVLTGVPPWDSEAFAEFCRRERRLLEDTEPGPWPSGPDVGRDERGERAALVALIATMSDAGESEEARARLSELDRVLGAAPTYSPAFVEASRLRRDALVLPGTREDRLATTRVALARVQELAGAVTANESAAVRRMTAELSRELVALESGEPDARR